MSHKKLYPDRSTNLHPHPTEPEWMKTLSQEPNDLPNNLRFWAIYSMMRQRAISRADIARCLGVSKQRVHQWLHSQQYDKLEDAITQITESRHLESCDCGETAHGVYLSVGYDRTKAGRLSSASKEWVKDE